MWTLSSWSETFYKFFLIAKCLSFSLIYIDTNGEACRDLLYTSVEYDRILANHTLRIIQPMYDVDTCTQMCYVELLCSSVNYCNKPGEVPDCELIDTDQSRHRKDIMEVIGCSFFGTKTSCSSNPCPDNATCSGDYDEGPTPYKCICPSGFKGSSCEEDINECTSNTHNCSKTTTCVNLHGSFKCICEDKDASWKVIFDFENGTNGWNRTGTAFNNQPTYGDNVKARNSKWLYSNHKGNYWIGTYENRSSPNHQAGGVQGDNATGMMASPPFVIRGPKLRFLIGGGGCEYKNERAELLIDDKVVFNETGACNETMGIKYWDVYSYYGKKARIRLVDDKANNWQHLNFDHLEGKFC